jgi:hypothetical protein
VAKGLALLIALAQLLAGLHNVIVPHELCLEHGLPVHGEHEHGTHSHEAERWVEPARHAPALKLAVDVGRPAFDHTHQHCMAASARERALAEPASEHSLELPRVTTRLPVAARVAVVLPRRAVYRLAPKQSPPVV